MKEFLLWYVGINVFVFAVFSFVAFLYLKHIRSLGGMNKHADKDRKSVE